MKVENVMSREVLSCGPDDDLGDAAMKMWRGDCGVLPVVWADRLVGMVTDRDVCMGLAFGGARPSERRVRDVMSPEVYACVTGNDLADALQIMANRRVRRLPVLDGDQLVGVVSLSDIVLHAEDRGHPPLRQILSALRDVSTPHHEIGRAPVAPVRETASTA